MVGSKVQSMELGAATPNSSDQCSNEQSKVVLDFYNQIPIKIRNHLDGFQLRSPQEIFDFLQPKLTSLENPYKLLNCEKACERLWNAWVNQESVLVYGDYDLDGTSGIILLYESLRALGFQNVHFFQPSKANDGYGLHGHVLEAFKSEQEIGVVVTVDVGITGNEACLKAKELGIDVLVTDHHLAQGELPDAFAIVNPNQPEDHSGLGYLSGCGVGFYLVRGLCKKWIEKGSPVKLDLKSVLPYFAIATVTDMVPLVKDNRTLLKFAFESFRNVTNFGLKALMIELDLHNKKLDHSDIGLQLAPKINAISRMSSELKPIDLFFQSNPAQASQFAKDILKLNTVRKRLQEAGLSEARQAYEAYRSVLAEDEKPGVFIYSSSQIHHGVTGLIASKLVEQFGGSFFIGSHCLETDIVVGSSRKSEKDLFSLVDMMAESRSEWIRFGGHANAAGFEYRRALQDRIIEGSRRFLEKLISSSESPQIDRGFISGKPPVIELDWFDMNSYFYSWVQFLEPFGNQFPEPIFRLRAVPIRSIKPMKEKHFKMNAVNPQNREELNFVLFNSNQSQRAMLNSLNRELEIEFKVKRDNFNYNQRFQFVVESISTSTN